MTFRTINWRNPLLATIAGIAAFAANAAISAASGADPSTKKRPVVVEFFTSQSCSSCIPAAAYFRDLAARDDVVALAWHVDYWNALQTKKGTWVDPYSSKVCTDRQRQYNINLRERSSVFTPQMVVGGKAESVGSKADKIDALIEEAHAEGAGAVIDTRRTEDSLEFAISESAAGGNAYLVTFKPQAVTTIKGGENAGREYHAVNAVTSVERLGAVRRIGATFNIDPPTGGYGCALFMQAPGQGAITAAAYCPAN